MKYFCFLLLWLFLFFSSLGQSTCENFKLTPNKPEPGQSIQIEYTTIEPYLNAGTRAFVFFNQPLELWSRAVEFPLEKIGDKLITTIISSPKDVSLLVVFVDSLGNVIDNNNDSGYWSPLYQNGETLPGSLASIANMYYGVAMAEAYKIKSNRDLARNLYDQDFKRKPELKRFYKEKYISSIRYDSEPALWLREIEQYSALTDLTDWEILDISKKYGAIKDTVNEKKFMKLILERHPMGEWALQQISTEYQIKYSKSKDAAERMAVGDEHRKTFANWRKTEDQRRYFETMEIVIFLKCIDDYIRLGKFEEWKGLTDSLRPRAKYMGYYLGARRLNEKEIFSEQAVELAKGATTWREQTLDSPRQNVDWPFVSDREVRYKREKQLSEWLDEYANTLRLQGKNEEARAVSRKAELYAAHQTAKLRNRPPAKLISKPLPSITFFDSNKKPVELSAYKGKTIVLDFWATWCAPCIAGFKKMEELENKFSKKNTVFLFVNTHEKGNEAEIRKRAENLLRERELSFKVLYDPQSKAASHFDFNALPTTIVIDKEGMIRYQQTGISEDSNLEEVISIINALK